MQVTLRHTVYAGPPLGPWGVPEPHHYRTEVLAFDTEDLREVRVCDDRWNRIVGLELSFKDGRETYFTLWYREMKDQRVWELLTALEQAGIPVEVYPATD